MPDIWFDDIDALVDAVSGIPESAVKEVTEEMKQVLLKHIKSDIYGAYTPKPGAWVNGTTYPRRYSLEGDLKSFAEPDGTLVVTSEATANQSVVKGYHFANRQSGAFLQLLESGHMGIWKAGFARPAVSNAQKDIDASSKIQSIVEKVMKREMR